VEERNLEMGAVKSTQQFHPTAFINAVQRNNNNNNNNNNDLILFMICTLRQVLSE
jgi:hypothetical protein